jgi:hypothetical protein
MVGETASDACDSGQLLARRPHHEDCFFTHLDLGPSPANEVPVLEPSPVADCGKRVLEVAAPNEPCALKESNFDAPPTKVPELTPKGFAVAATMLLAQPVA